MKRPYWLWIVPWIGVAVTAVWHGRLRMETKALQSTRQTAAPPAAHAGSPKPPPLPRANPSDNPVSPPTTSAGIPVLELLRRLGEPARQAMAFGLGLGHPEVTAPLSAALAQLSPGECVALAASDPDFGFATQFNLASVPVDERIDAVIRWRAYQKLAEVDPAAALRLTEGAPIKETSGEMINLVTSALQRWAETDAAAALVWGRSRADSLPLGQHHAYMALEALARHDMENAWAMARQHGFELDQAMAYLSRAISSPETCHAFMQEIAALQAAAPHGFVGGVNQFYTDLAKRLSNGVGFADACAFAERWASPVEWRDQVALAVAQTTFSRSPNAQAHAAADWAVAFSPHDRRPAAVERLVTAWAEEDFGEPAAWLQRHAQAPWRDTGLAALCRAVAPHDPAAAAEWAATIKDAELRARSLAALPSPPG
jgi:hypothetical protein